MCSLCFSTGSPLVTTGHVDVGTFCLECVSQASERAWFKPTAYFVPDFMVSRELEAKAKLVRVFDFSQYIPYNESNFAPLELDLAVDFGSSCGDMLKTA